MKSPRTYTAAEKQSAIRRALEIGPGAASRELGIPSGTLSCWAHKSRRGVAGFSVEPVPTAHEEPTTEEEHWMPLQDENLTEVIIKAAIEVHRYVGPGLLESASPPELQGEAA